MHITSIVKPTAQLGRVVELTVGDIYKRVERSEYASTTTLIHGVITDILSDGENTTVTAIEYVPGGYSTNKVEQKVFGPKDEVALYPADPDEFRIAVDGLIDSQQRAVDNARRELERQEFMLAKVVALKGIDVTAPTTAAISS